jgi:hypothetical protein
LQRLWRDFLHDLRLAYNNWLQPAYEFIAAKTKAAIQATCSDIGLLAKFIPGLIVRRSSSARPSRQSDYDDEEIQPSASSIGLEEFI